MKLSYCLAFVAVFSLPFSVRAQDKKPDWPAEVQSIHYHSSGDGSLQPALYYDPRTSNTRPLLVALHSWSSNYRQHLSIPYAQWCIEHRWIMIHPNFRGVNAKPEATGSDLVVADILSAVKYACDHAPVDREKIYLIGMSGGGMGSLLMAGRAPGIWAGVSSWVPIFDLATWYGETSERKLKYAEQILASLGGDPTRDEQAQRQAVRRSPASWLARASGVPLDINAGIHDGHPWCVPVSHSLHAFNELAAPADRLNEDQIREITVSAAVPEALRFQEKDRLYEGREIFFRRQSGAVRVTLFAGGHEILHEAGLAWLAHQRRAQTVTDATIEGYLSAVSEATPRSAEGDKH